MVQVIVCKTSIPKGKIAGHSHGYKKIHIFDDTEVRLYPTPVKAIVKRDWTASDIGNIAALLNASRGLSPFLMVYLTEEEVSLMQKYHEDLLNVSLVSTLEVKVT